MTYPTLDDREYSYTSFETAQGDNSFPGSYLDNDLDNVWTAVGDINEFLQVAHESDGTIKRGSISYDMLDSGLLTGISPPSVWATATAYAVDDTVTTDNRLYICLTAHTSGTFATDLAADKWDELAYFAPMSTVDDDAISTAKIQDDAVTTAKIDDGAVTAAKIADGVLTAAKAATSFGVVPVGAEVDFGGISAPTGWLFCYGQAVSRTTYASLFAVLTTTVVATTTNASLTLTAVGTDLRNLGLVGALIDGSGIVAGTTIASVDSASQITLSQAANGSNTGTTLRILPYGRGDGSTTFNLPDRRGRVTAGRDDMGGTAASRLTSTTVLATKLNATGGTQTHTLVTGEIPAHGHTVNDSGHTHGVTDPGHTHVVGALGAGAGATYADKDRSTVSNVTSGSSTTGVTVDSATTGITLSNTGGGGAHANVQPMSVANKIVFAGV